MDGIRSHSPKFKTFICQRFFFGLISVPCSAFAENITSPGHSSYTTSYYHHVTAISPFTATAPRSQKHSQAMPNLSVSQQSSFNQASTSKAVYQIITKPRKLASQAAAGLAIYGLDYIGMAKPIKEGVNYIKGKTRFDFGDCGKVSFSRKLKAKTCLFDNSSIELNSDYKMDEVTVNFNWSL